MDAHIKEAEQYLFHVYNRFPVVFSRGKGMNLYDENGKEYLDFGSGIGVMAFGYCDREYSDIIKEQVDKLIHTSNLFYHSTLIDAAKNLCKVSRMDKAFFTNSGAEAIEGAIKCAKKRAYIKNRAGQEIIAFNSIFHGRTVGALSVTGTEHYREPFYPLMDGVKFADFNDLDSVRNLVSDRTCAIIVEPVQGEGGIIPGDKEFLAGLRAICDENDMTLIFDEVQCGMYRTGSPYVWQLFGVRPDILVTAKGLGAGIPVGAFLLTDKMAGESMVPGDHGTTYGGNPIACAAVYASTLLMEKRDICARVLELSGYFEKKLDELSAAKKEVKSRRGIGFMQGLVLDVPVGDVVKKTLEQGLITLSAGGNVLRLLPPLIADKDDFDKMYEILSRILK